MADTSTAASHPPKAQQKITESINGALFVNTGSFMQSSCSSPDTVSAHGWQGAGRG